MVNLVTHRESKEARQRAHKLIEEVRKHKKIDGHYKFFCKIIGSRKRRCIVKDDNGKYDLDFQIVLTKNSKDGDGELHEKPFSILMRLEKNKQRNTDHNHTKYRNHEQER